MFINLHVHSQYSLLDGVSNPKELVARAVKLGQNALAITDHGTVSGWVAHYLACKENNITPLLGIEFYMARDEDDIEPNPFNTELTRLRRSHLIAIAKNQKGIDNITYLSSHAFDDIEAKRKPIIYENDLFEHSEGLIIISACVESYINSKDILEKFITVFGDDLYLEVQPLDLSMQYDMKARSFYDSGHNIQRTHNERMIQWSEKYNVKLVSSQDVHYALKDDKKIQDILILNSKVGKSTGWHFSTDTHYLMNDKEHWEQWIKTGMDDIFTPELFTKCQEYMQEIVDKCQDVNIIKPQVLRPFDISTHPLYVEGDTKDKVLMKIIKKVGRWNNNTEYVERFKYETSVIKEKGFLDYFFYVEDIIQWNNSKGYLVGPGRGSSSSSLLCYYMDITKIDPIKYGLIFSRFLDLSRTEMPDIDVDFAEQDATFEYIKQKYGAENVVSICAFQAIKVKTALKDVFRVMYQDKEGYSFEMINNVTKRISEDSDRDEDSQRELFKELIQSSKKENDRRMAEGKPEDPYNLYVFLKDKPEFVKTVYKILGKQTTLKSHPSAVVITSQRSDLVIPTEISSTGDKVTAFDGPAVEKWGEIKFDILSLKILKSMQRTLKHIKNRKNEDINPWTIPTDDKKVLDSMGEGDTDDIHQFNTETEKKLLIDIGVSSFYDPMAVCALGRPGPMNAGFPALYRDRKRGRLGLDQIYETEILKDGSSRRIIVPVKYSHPLMDEILKDTFGVLTYQEQAMNIFEKCGGFTKAETQKVRKAIGKKDEKLLSQQIDKFIKYATTELKPKWDEEQILAFKKDLLGFGEYCFCLAHNVPYSYIGYVGQWLKVHYPLEFWAGSLEFAGEKGCSRIISHIEKDKLVPIKAIDINISNNAFELAENDIIFPFKFFKGMGDKTIENIKKNRPYTSFEDFCSKMEGCRINKNSIINMIISGAFDTIEPDKTHAELIKYFILEVKKLKVMPPELQLILDDGMEMERRKSACNPFYRSNYMEQFKDLFTEGAMTISEAKEVPANTKVVVGGEIGDIKYILTKKGKSSGKNMCHITLKQGYESIKATLWADTLDKLGGNIDHMKGKIIEVTGKINNFHNNVSIVCNKLREVDIV